MAISSVGVDDSGNLVSADDPAGSVDVTFGGTVTVPDGAVAGAAVNKGQLDTLYAWGRIPVGEAFRTIGSQGNTTFVNGNFVRGGPIPIAANYGFDMFSCHVMSAYGAGAVFRMGLYECDADGAPVGDPIIDAGTVPIDTTGQKDIVVSEFFAGPGLYYLAGIVQGTYSGNGQLRSVSNNDGLLVPSRGTSNVAGWQIGPAAGAFSSVGSHGPIDNVPLIELRRSS